MSTENSALNRLPHGPEFRFVDRVVSLEPGQRAVGEYVVRGDEPFLRGHFPDNPILPGVILLEAATQLAGIVAQSDPSIPPLPGLKLTAIRNAKIFGTACPGDAVRLEAKLTGRMGRLVQAEVSGSVNSVAVLRAEITLSGEAD